VENRPLAAYAAPVIPARHPRRAALLAVVLTLTLAAALLLAVSASAYVYWADSQNGRIGRANNDGTNVEPNFIVGTGSLPSAVAVDAAHVYWVNQNGGSIGRANINGTGVDNSFITGLATPGWLAVNASSIFWSTLGGQIGKAKIDGTMVQKELVKEITEPCGVALDSGHVYWSDIGSLGTPAYIGRAGLDGTNPERHFVTIPGTSYPCGVAVNSANIFWSEPGIFGGGTRIGRANTNTGTGADPSFIGDARSPCGIAVHGSQLYWANSETDTIARANTDGTSVNQGLIATGGNQICGVAVDDLVSPPAPPAPETPAQSNPGNGTPGPPAPPPDRTPPQAKILKGPGAKLAEGKAGFRFSSSEPSPAFQCSLGGPKLKAKARPCKSPRRYSGLTPGSYVFKVWATDTAGNKSKPAKRSFRVPAASP
jgi:streptogramin lyase